MADYIVHKAVERSALSAKTTQALEANEEWIITPKYDGCHAVFLFDDGKHVGTLSRTGEPVRSMPHIATALLDTYPLAAGRIAICGEAWSPGLEFNEISGLFRRHTPSPQLGFVPFDIVPFDHNGYDWQQNLPTLGVLDGRAYPAPYRKRLAALLDQRNPKAPPSLLIKPRHYEFVGTLQMAWDFASVMAQDHKRRTDSFYDGAILAPANGKYIVGSGKGGEFIKVKPLISYTVQVTGAALDFGTKTGKNTAALKFMLDGHEQKVSTGLTQQQVDEITAVGWDGYHIEVEAMGLTVNGLLREPRFKGIRTDI